jgi:hypothetical protein
MTKWYRLDNAAKIYPVLSTERYTHVFRVSITLKEKIIPSVLSKAIQDMRDRFPTFYVKLKHGLFWFYFEPNDKNPIVKEESSIICQKINIHRNNGFYFTFLYYENRISLEVFHALSDGAGAIIFLKSVVFQYLRLLDRPVESEGEIFTLGELPTYKEIEDSYEINCTKAKKIPNRIPDAYLVTGKRFEYVGCGVINSEIDTQKLLALSKEKNCSLTQYIVALLIHSLIVTGDSKKLRQKPINVCVPINLRPLYHSETLRNFSLYFHVSYYSKTDDPDIDDIITIVKKAFENEMTPEKIQSKLNSNVLISKKIYVRFLPLFIKKVLFKIAYTYYAKKPTTITIANFGNVSLPSSMVQYVDSFTFNLGSGSKPAVAMNSFNGKTKIIFSRALVSTEIEKAFFTYLTSNKLEVKIESNHFETNCKPEIK